jgi:hypothetical protein
MTCLIALIPVVAVLVTVGGVVYIASVTEQPPELPNKWGRMTGKPCQPPDRTGLPTSPPPPRRRQ